MARIFRTGRTEAGRIEAFSDGVIAIVITLLVLEVKLPETHLHDDAAIWVALAERLPIIGAWILSFVFVLVFWVAHHGLFKQIREADRGLLWLNGLFLLAVSFVPFPTGLFGEYPGSEPSTFLLSLAMFLTASSFSLMRWYASFPGRLLRDETPEAARRAAMRRSLTAPVLYALSMAAAFVAPALATAVLIAVPVLFFLPQRLGEAPQA